jgi:hypothetical protein
MTFLLYISVALFMVSIVFAALLATQFSTKNTDYKMVSVLALGLIIITLINIGLSIFNTVKNSGMIAILSVIFGCVFSFVFLVFGAVNFKYKNLK